MTRPLPLCTTVASGYSLVYNGVMPSVPLRPILETPRVDLLAWLAEHGQPRMRAGQIHRWLVAGRAESFEQMTDVPRALRQQLAGAFQALGTRSDCHQSAGDDTHKLLLRLTDDRLIECVLINE